MPYDLEYVPKSIVTEPRMQKEVSDTIVAFMTASKEEGWKPSTSTCHSLKWRNVQAENEPCPLAPMADLVHADAFPDSVTVFGGVVTGGSPWKNWKKMDDVAADGESCVRACNVCAQHTRTRRATDATCTYFIVF